MAKGIKDGTVRIDAGELAALMRQAAPSRAAVVRAAQGYRRAMEALDRCAARARAARLSFDTCHDAANAVVAAQNLLIEAALAVALDDE